MKNNTIYRIIILVICAFLFDAKAQELGCTLNLRSHIRQAPSTSSAKIKTLTRYTPLKIIDKHDNWYEVKGIDFKGFIYKSLLDTDTECLSIKTTNNLLCKYTSMNYNFKYHETFKVLKKEIGCNLVQNIYGKKLWIKPFNIWPASMAKLLDMN